jgi:hypothetical protein
MPWEIIKTTDADVWNEKLKQTTAPFYQYPYYISPQYSSLFSGTIFIVYKLGDGHEIAFCAVIEIGNYPFKIGVIDGGPVLLKNNIDISVLIEDLKAFAQRKHYMHLQVRPATQLEKYFETDSFIKNQIFFPFHMKEEYDFNIYNKPEEELLAGFKLQCRRKIVLAGRVPFKFCKLEDKSELKNVHNLFQEITKTKGYHYTPFNVFLNIFTNGKKHDLCDIYVAYLNDEIVNAVFIVKDAQSFYHLSSGLMVKGYMQNESPPAKLHYFLMQDCFYEEHKEYYNISYGGSDNLIRFKELFNPVEIEKPPYYTYVINKKTVSFLSKISPKQATVLRSAFNHIKKFIGSYIKVALLLFYLINNEISLLD